MGQEINHQMNKIASCLLPGAQIIAQGVNGIKASKSLLRLSLLKGAGGSTNLASDLT